MKGLALLIYKVHSVKKVLRKKSVLDMKAGHLIVLGFVNAFGYLLPTLYMLRNGKITIFEYLFQSLYIDLVFTTVLSLVLLKRSDLHSFKVLVPVALCGTGMAFHYLAATDSKKYSGSSISVLTFIQASSVLSIPNVNT